MPLLMTNSIIKRIGLCLCIAVLTYSSAQTNNLTGSPYSLFGIGVESTSNTGRNSGMGRLGIGIEAIDQINLYNPASFSTIDKERFAFDFGFFSEIQSVSSDDSSERRFATNFSNIAIAFNGNGNYGIGLSLTPATSVGYTLIGVESNIEGSNEQFVSNILGSGGLNDVRLDYSRRISKNFHAGLRFSYLFGNVDETESVLAANSLVSTNEVNTYSGALFGLGLLYKFKERHSFGLTLNFPTRLGGTRDTRSEKISLGALTILEETTDERIDDFSLPLRLGVGFSSRFKNLLLAADYSSSFWSNTNQSDGVGDYINQHVFALGSEYIIDSRSLNYWKRVVLRAGLNYSTGYLDINTNNVTSLSASFGIGLPLGNQNGSYINISYNGGQRGSTDSFLVQENFNTININLTLSGIWFQKRKYN